MSGGRPVKNFGQGWMVSRDVLTLSLSLSPPSHCSSCPQILYACPCQSLLAWASPHANDHMSSCSFVRREAKHVCGNKIIYYY